MESDMERGSWLQVAIHYKVTDTILDIILYGTLQRTGTKLNVVALRGNKLLCLLREVDAIAYLPDALIEASELDVDNLFDGLKVELVEGDDLIETVKELWRELFRQRFLHDAACMLLILFVECKARS